MNEKILIDDNNIPRITSREVARSSTYQHCSVKQHIEKIKKEKQLSERECEKLFKKDFFIDQSNGNKYEQYLVSADGLKTLRQLKERYTKCKPLYVMLREVELEIAGKGFMLEESPKLTTVTPKQSKPIEEDLQNENGQIVVSSRMVAERFGKQHKHVLDNIEELIKGVAEKSADLFISSKYQHPQNKQWYPEYLMTRDGFTLLAMGFTGKEALQFKLAYIEAFNKMEEALKNQSPVLPTTYKDALVALLAEVEAKEKLQLENKEQQKVIEVMKPKSEYCDMVLKANGTVTISVIAKDYGMTGQRMNSLLHELGVQYKRGNTWLLYVEHDDKGYTKSETYVGENGFGYTTNVTTKWTQKGRMFIYELLKEKRGLLPIIERGDM